MNANRTKLGLESLEAREVLSSYTYNVATGEVSFTGTAGNDYLEIAQTGAGGQASVWYRVSAFGAWQAIPQTVGTISVQTLGGNDTVNYSLTGNVVPQTALPRSLQVNLGDQDDTFTATVNGNVHGIIGAYHLLSFGLSVQGEDGNDRLTGSVNGDITNQGALSLAFDGGRGIDFLTVNATNDVDIAQDSFLGVWLSGQEEHGNIQFHYRGELDGQLSLELKGGDAYDWLVANINLDSGSRGYVGTEGSPAVVSGAGSADDLEFRLKDNSGGAARIWARLWGGGGTDRFIASSPFNHIALQYGSARTDWQFGESFRYV